MEERLKSLEKSVSLIEAEIIEDEFSVISGQSEIPEDAQRRILSSVMKKAGFGVNEALPMMTTEENSSTNDDMLHTAEVVRSRHGGAIAACVAAAAVGVLSAVLVLGGDIQTYKAPAYKSDQREMHDDSVPTGDSVMTEVSEVETESTPDDNSFYDESSEAQEIVSQQPNDNQVKMPNLVGYSTITALELLCEKGLDCEIKYDGKKAQICTVLEQSVAADEVVDKGTVVELYATGEEQYLLEIPVPEGLSGACEFTVCKVENDDNEKTITTSSSNRIELYPEPTIKFLLNAEPGDRFVLYYTLSDSGITDEQLYARYIFTDDGEFVPDGEQDNDGSASG